MLHDSKLFQGLQLPVGLQDILEPLARYKTNHKIPTKNNAFFLLLSPGNAFLVYAKMIPNNAPREIPYTAAATISPLFCQIR